MAKERLKSPRARLFVALDLPGRVRRSLVAWQEREIEPVRELRPVAPEALHITLAFIGYLPERQVERAAEAATAGLGAAAPRVELRPEPVGRPPNRPRVVAIEAESPGVVELQAEVSGRLEAERLYRPEKRAFWPHLTVARVRPERRGSRRPAPIERDPGALPADLLEPFDAVRVTLYRSILRPQGARYVPVASIELPSEHG